MPRDLGGPEARSRTWFRKSWDTVARMGRGAPSATLPGASGPLRSLFSDLIAYVLFFEATCREDPPSVSDLREKVLALVAEQEKRVSAGEATAEAYREARFAVLSWVDEIILNSAWPYRSQWRHLMLTSYGTLNAGEEFFDRLARLPSNAQGVREIYYLCLKLGFLGRYAVGDSPTELRELTRSLYRQISGFPNDVRQSYPRLFPQAYEGAPTEARQRVSVIYWACLVAAVLLPVLLFVIYSYVLRAEADRLLAAIEKPIEPFRQEPDWMRSLIEELRNRGIDAQETARGVLITLPDLLFEVNRSQLSGGGTKKIEEVASVVKKHAPDRRVAVEGHASRERGTPEETNLRLSDNRAAGVRDALLQNSLRGDRLTERGFGSSNPIASNESEEGRRKNRRVEIIVERGAR